AAPTAYAGVIRVRSLSDSGFVPAEEGTLNLNLEIRGEPKIQLQRVSSVTVEKALDDHGQNLQTIINAGPGGAAPPALPIIRPQLGGNVGPAAPVALGAQLTAVRLKRGEKDTNRLKELTGTLRLQVVAPREPLITADKILTAAGQTFKGKEGGFLKVIE